MPSTCRSMGVKAREVSTLTRFWFSAVRMRESGSMK
jgi:hypothetical protein